MSYRGGYTPAQRRQIEKQLFSDQLRGVAATNALELGVDVGSMDATLHLGFQRSISSLWQQAGRAGRRNGKSLSIYVAWDSPIDQVSQVMLSPTLRRSPTDEPFERALRMSLTKEPC
jgi:DEAD/DEAH box helicase domain-containing protein